MTTQTPRTEVLYTTSIVITAEGYRVQRVHAIALPAVSGGFPTATTVTVKVRVTVYRRVHRALCLYRAEAWLDGHGWTEVVTILPDEFAVDLPTRQTAKYAVEKGPGSSQLANLYMDIDAMHDELLHRATLVLS